MRLLAGSMVLLYRELRLTTISDVMNDPEVGLGFSVRQLFCSCHMPQLAGCVVSVKFSFFFQNNIVFRE